MARDPKSKKVTNAKAAKNTMDAEIAAEVVDDSKPKLKKGKNLKKLIINKKSSPNAGELFLFYLNFSKELYEFIDILK
ncbi:hypothetical protein CUW_1881 [Turicibacter sanguinis PC909]|uniref:Uncharacterized protein n=1 Tax=Turicibacter sanguinis PC909 TaxID=702450 RepID=A0ABN0A2M2_9FIRM|nr:hypothetical protein [Turicibacter sanguinis]EFF63932.1 hypothetical protein CUW_1881 [Turicibacter sanguinis PC909]